MPVYPIKFFFAVYSPPDIPIFSVISAEPKSLTSFRGRTTMLHFWSYLCSPCVAELPGIIGFAKKNYDILRFVPILVSEEESEQVFLSGLNEFFKINSGEKWVSDASDFEWYFDRNRKLFRTFWALAVPSTIFLDPKGRVVYLQENEIVTPIMVGERNWGDERYSKLVEDIFLGRDIIWEWQEGIRNDKT
jgi:thiol-disulfide isomerase/thioredoxin